MQQTLRGADIDRLERSCDSIRMGTGAPGLERAEVRMSTFAYEPHRHDTYAIGVTLGGVQSFRYRGRRWIGRPGQLHILHPDVTHDGAAATEAQLRYRILYVEPELVRRAMGGGPLPFVPEPLHEPSPATRDLLRLLADFDEPVGDLALCEAADTVARALSALGGRPAADAGPIDLAAVGRVREHLTVCAREQTPAAALERIAGLDRFTIARHFRRAYGTSPDRYRTMRRLELARREIHRGMPLVDAAAAAGFADQSHMTRQFKRAYGLTPGRWARSVGQR
ncbi:MAG: AraC family transcriptional regulator [Gaiellales bacterium]